MLINEHGLLQTVEIGSAIRTRFQMFLDGLAFGGIDVFIKLTADVFCHVQAVNLLKVHVVIYSLSCSRRKTLARRSRDFTAGTDNLSIFATSSAD